MNRPAIALALSVLAAGGAIASCSLFVTFNDALIPADDTGIGGDVATDGTPSDLGVDAADAGDVVTPDATDAIDATDGAIDSTPTDEGVDGADATDTAVATDSAADSIVPDVAADLGTDTTVDDATDAD